MTAKAKKTGRPSDYSTETTAVICKRISEGESLRAICRDEGMPAKGTVLRWLDKHEEFRDQYARARDLQADHFCEEILEIADDASNDWMKRERGGKKETVFDSEHVQRSKLRIDSRKWIMARVAPKKYGEKPSEVVQVNVANPGSSQLDPEMLAGLLTPKPESEDESPDEAKH